MTPDISDIENLTREAFSLSDNQALTTNELLKGGSGRRFYRISNSDTSWSAIAMHFTAERPENARFETATHFLASENINVPNVLGQKLESHLLWLTDLGNKDLWTYRNENWDKKQAPLYRAALDQVFKIHTISVTDNSELPLLEAPFDSALYQWEQDYFFKEFASRFSTCSEKEIEAIQHSQESGDLINELSQYPRQLIHRDFQSQNIMIFDNDAWLIDYQGMRLGLPEYDIASLLFDPYVSIPENHQDELILYYFSLKQKLGHADSLESFRRRLFLCATQRLMQALGAYGFLGIGKKKTSFLEHIPPAVERLRKIAVDHQTFPDLARVLSLEK